MPPCITEIRRIHFDSNLISSYIQSAVKQYRESLHGVTEFNLQPIFTIRDSLCLQKYLIILLVIKLLMKVFFKEILPYMANS